MNFFKSGAYCIDTLVLSCKNNIYTQDKFETLVKDVVEYLSNKYIITMVSIQDDVARVYYHLPD